MDMDWLKPGKWYLQSSMDFRRLLASITILGGCLFLIENSFLRVDSASLPWHVL